MRYKWNVGSLAWLVHRITGLLLTLYLVVHIYVLSHLKSRESFERIMEVLNNPLVKFGELILLAILLKHAFAGLRITLLELGLSTKLQRPLAYIATITVLVLWLFGAYSMFFGVP